MPQDSPKPPESHDAVPTPQARGEHFARFLHRDSKSAPMGAVFAPTITPTSLYALPGDPAGAHQYARWSNPGWSALEAALGELDAASAVIFPSGAAAICSLFASRLRPGERLLLQADGYMGTRVLAEKFFVPFGVQVDLCSTRELASRSFAGYRMALVESPSNPGLDLVDLRTCAARAREHDCWLVVDNTLMSPLGQQPLALGAEAVVYSDTKILNGHSDVLFGHVASRNAELIAGVSEWRRVAGAIPGPFETWMVQRGLETLELRQERMQASALALAQALAARGGPLEVVYPGLPGHPAHALACAQMQGFGPLIGLTLPDRGTAERFIQECRYLRPATSFGGLHASAECRARWGDPVPGGFIRLSVGCEPPAALQAEVLRALDVVLGPPPAAAAGSR